MNEVMNVGETILLDGEPLSLVTRAGVEAWIESDIKHTCRYDQVRSARWKAEIPLPLREGRGGSVPFVLVNSPSSDGGRVILFDEKPN